MSSVPPKFTAYQGFDAIFHSLEGYVSKFANLMSDMYAHTAIYNVSHYLPRAVKNRKDMEAREKVAFANSLSGTLCVLELVPWNTLWNMRYLLIIRNFTWGRLDYDKQGLLFLSD